MRKGVLAVAAVAGVATGALPALAQSTHSVTIADFSFTPKTVSVAVNDTVRWTSGGTGANHSVVFQADGTSFSQPSPADNGPHDVSYTFKNDATVAYVCGVHGQSMSGTIVVGTGGTTTTGTTTTGTTTTTTTTTMTTTTTTTPPPTEEALVAEAAGLTLKRRIREGRVRGTLRAGPQGARLTVRVRRAGRIAGTASRTLAEAGTVAFAVRLNRAARRQLARTGRLKVAVRADVKIGDSSTFVSRTARLR